MATLAEQQALANQAYAAWTGAPMVPLAGGADPSDPLAQQDAMLAAQAQQDAQMAAAGPPAPPPAPAYVDPASVSSMPAEMSPGPAPLTEQQQLAANAYRTWSPSAPPLEGLGAWQPPPAEAGPPAPPPAEPKVIAVPEQEISATAPTPRAAGAGGPARPTLLTEQAAMAGASRDAADQARTDAEISTDIQAGLTEIEGEQKSETAKLMAARAEQQQADLEEAGRVANERRAVKEAAAADVQAQYKRLTDEAAAVQIADRRTTGNRVMGALGIALAGMGDAIAASGGNRTNFLQTTVGLISEAVERDLAIQRTNLENKRASAAAKYSELGLAREAIKDVDAQEIAAKAALMDKYALGLDAIKAQGLGETATTTAALAAEQIRGNAAQLRAQAMEQQATKDEDRLWALQVQREQERKAAAAAKNKAPRVSELERKLADGSITAPEMKMLNDLREGVLKNEKAQRDLSGGAARGEADLPGYQSTQTLAPADMATARKIHAAAESLKADYARLAQIRAKNNGGTVLNKNDIVEAEALINGMGPKYSQLYGSGAPSQTEFENFTRTLIDPTDYQITGLLDPTESYSRGVNQIDAITKAQLGSYGYQAEASQADEYAAKYGARER